MTTRLRLRGATLAVPVADPGGGRVTVSVGVDGRRLARRRARAPESGSRLTAVRIPRRHLRLLRRARSVRVTISNEFDEKASVLLPGPSR